MIFGLAEIILVLLIEITCFVLAVLVYFKNSRMKSNQSFAALTLFVMLWILSAFLSEISRNQSLILFLSRLTYFAALWATSLLFIFSLYFPKECCPRNKKEYLVIGGSILFSFLILFTNLIIRAISQGAQEFNLVFGKIYFLYIFYCVSLLFLSLINFLKSYKYSSVHQRLQLKYLFLGIGIFGVTVVIVDVIVRALINSDIYYRIGNYSVVFFIGFASIAILKYHLFNIKVVLTEILVALIAVLLLLQVLLTHFSLQWFLWLGIFLVFLYLGYMLIKSVLKEIKRREQLELLTQRLKASINKEEHQRQEIEKLAQELKSSNDSLKELNETLEEKVRQRTQELERAKQSLEIKVKERTKELQELTQFLEKRVQQRTKELAQKAQELEKWYNLTVGRELKMIELKKKIKELERETIEGRNKHNHFSSQKY